MARFAKRKTVLIVRFVLGALVVLWGFGFSPRYQLEILDNHFPIVAFQASQGAKHSIYRSNPLLGKLSAKLQQFNMHIQNPSIGLFLSAACLSRIIRHFNFRVLHPFIPTPKIRE